MYPRSDPNAAASESILGTGGAHNPPIGQILSNPFVLNDALNALDHALTRVISTIENDADASGASAESGSLLSKFRGWQGELVGLRKGAHGAQEAEEPQGHASQGGMFTD